MDNSELPPLNPPLQLEASEAVPAASLDLFGATPPPATVDAPAEPVVYTPAEPVAYAPAEMSASLEEQILFDVEHGDLATAINRLSPELRMVVQATLVDGLTTREAARLLNIPVGTVKTRMMRAKPLLREQLA